MMIQVGSIVYGVMSVFSVGKDGGMIVGKL